MKNLLLTNLAIVLMFSGLLAQPTDNPVATYYGETKGYPGWTDDLKWSNVINMATYTNGATNFLKFENARDELYNQGGGVLYYPAGTYDFSDAPVTGPSGRGLMLKKGVVIRGETPSGDKNAADGTLVLPTKFVFKFNTKAGGQVPADWNIIGITPSGGEQLKDVHKVGVAWLHIEGATVYFGAQMTWGATFSTAGAWKSSKVKSTWANRVPDGRHPMDPFCGSPLSTSTYEGAGSGRLVFGCKFDNSTVLNDIIDEGFGSSGFFMYKFGARISVYGSQVYIANNTLPKPTKCFKYAQNTSGGANKTILFDYGDVNGIDVNKTFLNINTNKADRATGGYWKEGIIIKDNYIYNHGRKGMDVSGTYMVIQGNFNDRDYLLEGDNVYGVGAGYELTLDGYNESQAGGAGNFSDNESRGYDVAGKAVWIDNNKLNNTGSEPGNDGEGILAQRHGGTDIFSWAITRNLHTKGSGEAGYFGSYDTHNYGLLIAWNTTPGSVGHINAKSSNDLLDASIVDNIATNGTKTDCAGTCDFITTCPSGSLTSPINVSANASNGYIEITFQNNSENEIGFRIERKVSGSSTWTPISYRPRISNGHVENEQKWRDYNAASGVNYEYRVVAVNCNDDASGASVSTSAVSLDTQNQEPVSGVDRQTLLPSSTWESSYQSRLNSFLNYQTWNYLSTSSGDQDNGKRFWPMYLAELAKGNASTSILQTNNRGVYNQWEGSIYKPFSGPGLLMYYYKYATPEHKLRIENHWNGSLYGNGLSYASRADGNMDPIYSCTEFNSENFNWMSRTFGYMMSHQLNDTREIGGVPAKTWFDNYLDNLTKATFSTGRVEWNSQIYTGFCIQALDPVYQFATWNPQAQQQAAAVMDWLALETALHSIDGTYVGPKSRGKGNGYLADNGSISPYYYLWFNQGTLPGAVKAAGSWSVGFAKHMAYRPLDIILDIANRNFATPLEIQSAKPFYDLDVDNYAYWNGSNSDSRRFEYETIWIDANYTMASVAAARPRGERTFVEQELWGIAVKQTDGTALQVFGNADNNNNSGDDPTSISSDITGRSPYQEIGQYRNTMMQLIKGGNDQFIYVPDSKNPSFDGEIMFVDMGSGVYIAAIPYNHTGKSNAVTRTGADDGLTYRKFRWDFNVNQLGALIIETGTVEIHGSFTNFKNAIKNNSNTSLISTDLLQYTSTQGNKIKMEWVPTGTYQYQYSNAGQATCYQVTVNPAGVVSKVWGDDVLIDFSNWDSYRVSHGEKIVEQKWGSAQLRMQAGNKGVEIKVDPSSANVQYGTFSPSTTQNELPTSSITSPANNASFTAGSNIIIQATASDSDGTIAKVEFYTGSTKLGEDTSSPYSYTWNNPTAGSYALTAKAFDNAGASTTSSTVNIVVQAASTINLPGKIEAENYSAMLGVQTQNTSDTGGGQNVGYIGAGDWMDYEVNVETTGTYTISYRVASTNTGRQFELRQGNSTLHTVTVPNTTGYQKWTTVTATAQLTAGSQTLRIFVVSGGWNINWFQGEVSSTPATITATASSSENSTNTPDKTLDNDFNTRWSSNGSGQWIQYDLGNSRSLTGVEIAWFKGNERQYSFSVLLSSNASDWTTLLNTSSSGTSTALESYTFSSTTGRYVRIVCSGSNVNSWNSITEVRFSSSSGSTSRTGYFLETDEQDQTFDLKVYPNPANTTLSINILADASTTATLIVADLAGRVANKSIHKLENGINIIDLNVSQLEEGTYLFTITHSGKVVKGKFFKSL